MMNIMNKEHLIEDVKLEEVSGEAARFIPKNAEFIIHNQDGTVAFESKQY